MTQMQCFAGKIADLEGRPSAIRKLPLHGPFEIGPEGIVGDEQADRRVHGGPEKAIHFFPQENYARLAAAFPERADSFIPGSIGENLSCAGWPDAALCIGDVFALGEAQLQLCQPRTPCWKIDSRYGLEGLALYIANHGLAGCYFRVLRPGRVEAGANWQLIARNPEPWHLDAAFQFLNEVRPDQTRLQQLIAEPGLARHWQRKLEQRLDWLQKNT
ncbi:MAG: hypothetical protein RIR00_400 [Pseudomonadota bacterium]